MWAPVLLALCGFVTYSTNVVEGGFYPTEANQNCVYACDQALTYVHFKDEKKDASNTFVPKCSSVLRAQSLVFCAEKYCSQHDIVPGLNAQNESCWRDSGLRFLSLESVLSELPAVDDPSANITVFKKKASKKAEPLENVSIPSSVIFEEFLATVTLYYNNFTLSLNLAYATYGFWALVVMLGLVYRIASRFARPQLLGKTIQRRLLIPALFKSRHQETLKPFGSIPTRLETTIIALYFVMIFIFMFPGYDLVQPNLWWPKVSVQYCRLIADRAAHLAIANLSILFVFGVRNNPFLWVTGWSYSTFNTFHRWTARIVILVLIVHAVCQTLATTYTGPGEYSKDLAKVYFQYGISSIVIYGTLLGTSGVLRRRYYDAWLVTHIILAAGLLAAVFGHIKIWNGGFNGFIWPCVATWAFDRVCRLGRILLNSKGIKRASATLDTSGDIIRLDVTDHVRGEAVAGHNYYYVYVLSGLAWQNHPFSLCTWTAGASDSPKHTFLVRPRSGFTRRLRQKLLSHKTDTESSTDYSMASFNLMIEGPYGTKHDLSKHSNITMIAGGSGIAALVSYAHTILLRREGSTTLHVVWAVPEARLADDVTDKELSALIGHPRLQLDVFVTRHSSPPATPSSEQEKSVTQQVNSATFTTFFGQRPEIHAILESDRAAATKSLGVVCCGPPKMADDVREATVDLLRQSGASISFYNESFGW